jgi:hypothetical protein
MLNSARKHLRSVAVLGVAGALALGGVAVAQNDSGDGGNGKAQNGKGKSKNGQGQRHRGGPPGLGVPMKGVTYAEFHIQTKEGEAEVIRLDQGEITAVGESSITLKANDDSEVTVSVDDSTKVLGKPGSKAGLDDLEEGQAVVATGPKGGTAKTIAPLPKKGERKGPMGGERNGPMGDRQQGEQPGPPPSGRIG